VQFLAPSSVVFYYPTVALPGMCFGRRLCPRSSRRPLLLQPALLLREKSIMKIDIFNHIFPKKFFDKYIDAGHGGKDIGKRVSNIQTIVDIDSRFRILDEFGDYVQVITLPL